ncbi:MAG: SpoIIE family protein phosphatase [Clostridia bacterium]|nr:SpoIIE family protein phosphatase [Clostridia bacterium]
MKKAFDPKRAAPYAAELICGFFLSQASGNYLPLPFALLAANLFAGFKKTPSAFLCFLPFLLSRNAVTIACAAWGCAFLGVVFGIYSSRGKKPTFALLLYMAAALAPYIMFTNYYGTVIRLALSLAVIPLTFVFISAVKVWTVKRLKYRLGISEMISATLLFVLSGIGAVGALGGEAWKIFSVFIILFASAIFPFGYGLFPAFACSLPLAIADGSFTPIAVFALYAVAAQIFTEYSRLIAALSVVGVESALFFLTNVYAGGNYYVAALILIPVSIFAFLPEKLFVNVNRRIRIYRTPSLNKYSVNRARAALSDKVYEIAAALDETSRSVGAFSCGLPSEKSVVKKITDELVERACLSCPSYNKCRNDCLADRAALIKAVRIGLSKGKFNLIDLPNAIAGPCERNNDFSETLDGLIKEYALKRTEAESMGKGRELVSVQAAGLSEALKGLAFSTGSQSESDSSLEKAIYENLARCGIYASEITVFGEDADTEINLVVPPAVVKNPLFLEAINEITGYKSIIVGRLNFTDDLSAITVRRAPKFDAAFGIAQKTKEGKRSSGDSHSMTRISENKFMIALNDGMGSGEDAMNTSCRAISLIESLFKSGLPPEAVLSTANKILSFSSEDDFTALDLGLINLDNGEADLIKVGSPYSFIITDESVKIIEGNSLPLGIVEEIKPTVIRSTLGNGDVMMLVSDGVSDAFGSASDMTDYLSTKRTVNPKALADDVLTKALTMTDGKAKDDMTVYCVRLFDRW